MPGRLEDWTKKLSEEDWKVGELVTDLGRPPLRGATPPDNETGQPGVTGISYATKSLGLLGGRDRVFLQDAGVYGQSGQQGVFGHSTDGSGTGV